MSPHPQGAEGLTRMRQDRQCYTFTDCVFPALMQNYSMRVVRG